MSNITERILKKENYTVVGAGDSHMWGEGASGWQDALDPAYVIGELRRLPREIPSFLSLFEKNITKLRNDIGTTSVINSGFGCASTKKYIECFWDEKVMVHKPDLVILEFAINDWIADRQVSVEEFRNNLEYMTSEVYRIGGDVMILTVSPILGDQNSEDHFYSDYIEASREFALKDNRVILADANINMEKYLARGNRQENEKILFEDVWHVTQIGHEIYCQSILESIDLA